MTLKARPSFAALMGLIVLLWTSVIQPCRAELTDPAIARKVARLELARSIRAFAASPLATGQCLVERGRLNQQDINSAMPIALRELGISAVVLTNPQVRKAAQMLQSDLDADCGLSRMDASKALQLVRDEL